MRFGQCDLRCRWCDSPHTWKPAAECRFELSRGSGRFGTRANPIEIDAAVAAAEALDLPAHRFVSLTGGEPLLQPEAARQLAQAFRARGPRIYLETHGLAVEPLEQIVDVVDVVSMDWKLASDVRREGVAFREPGASFDAEHERFLQVALRAAEVFVKVVVTPATLDAELREMAARVASVDAAVPLVVQPVTPCGGVMEAPSAQRLLGIVAELSQQLRDVRLVPQTHKGSGVL